MTEGFLFIKSEDRIIRLDQIFHIEFLEDGSDDNDQLLTIHCTDEVDDAELTGDEAEEAYLDLVSKLPNLITIGK